MIKISHAWIVTYKAVSHYDGLNGKVLSVLKWQKSERQIREHVTQLYVDNRLSCSEVSSFLRSRGDNGLNYKAKSKIVGGRYLITIGHDPFLEARQVKNLGIIEVDGKEEWCWKEFSE